MLSSLNIRNFALIDQLQLDFEDGFTVFTGETGSGKSILLGALNLILGERADYSAIRNENLKTVVEAGFKLKGYQLEAFFQENDLDFSEETLIRREITNQGKSRAFVNDTPVQLTVLKDLAERLIHIHSQHHTLELKNEQFQLDILDYLSDTISLRTDFQQQFKALKKLEKSLAEKKNQLLKIKQEEDYIQFQLAELDQLQLHEVNYQELEQELDGLEHFDSIKETFEALQFNLSGDQQILEKLSFLKTITEKNAGSHPALLSISERIKSTLLELKEIQYEAEKIQEHLKADPQRKATLEAKLSKFNTVLTKNQLKNQEALMEVYSQYKLQDDQSQNLQEEVDALEKSIATAAASLKETGLKLHQQRITSKTGIENQLTTILTELKMDKTQLDFSLEELQSPSEFGFSKLTILFSPNPGLAPKAIEKTASGGELSRLMLAVQLLLSDKKMLPTLIFDEIDTGVSGDVAQKLGELLKRMGKKIQVMAITHLPQVAAKGNQHFKVLKTQAEDGTQTSVEFLSQDQRITEIARLMSGENISEAAISNAKALMA